MEKLIERYLKIAPLQRLGAAALLTAGLAVAYYMLVFDGQRQELARIEENLQKAIAQAADKQNVTQHLRTYEERLAGLQSDLDRAKALLPDNADVPELLAQLGNISRLTGLQITNFNPKGEQLRDFYSEIAFDVAVVGSYHEIAMFIDQIGKLDRIMNVTDLSMQKPTTVAQRVVVDGRFLVKTYRFVSDDERRRLEASQKKGKG